MSKKIKLGLIGLGTVGSGVVKVLENYKNIEIVKIAVNNINKKRDIANLNTNILTDNANDIVNNQEVDIVVEVAGGIGNIYELVKTAIKNKKHIVTANKELVAKHGEELFELAKENNVVVLFEAAVAGGIPIIMPLKTSLAGNNITKIAGILNGTTNYILTRMENEKVEFETVLEDAQRLGYAEADPTSDVGGHDAAYKIAIAASLAFNKRVDINKIFTEGIEKVTPKDTEYASEFGYKIKLIALAQKLDNDKADVRVHPMLVSKKHPLSSVDDVLNAVVVEGHPVGRVMFSGSGAGEFPTASSVVGDILCLAEEMNITENPLPMMRCKHKENANLINLEDSKNKYYIRINTVSVPGVMGRLGIICGNNNINLLNIIQKEKLENNITRVVLLTDTALEKDLQKALKEIEELPEINKIQNVLRVMD